MEQQQQAAVGSCGAEFKQAAGPGSLQALAAFAEALKATAARMRDWDQL